MADSEQKETVVKETETTVKDAPVQQPVETVVEEKSTETTVKH